MTTLEGKVAVVTGASEGIGEAIVRKLAAKGMKVAALARREELLKKIETEETLKGNKVKGYACDVSDKESIKSTFKKIDIELGGVKLLVNNAGVFKSSSVANFNTDNTRAMFDVNLFGVLFCSREALDLMNKWDILDGHIVNINSVAGHRQLPFPQGGIYTASKHALTVICESLRSDLERRKQKTRVTSISPGLVKTTMSTNYRLTNPYKPYLEAENIADAVMYAVTAPPNVNVSELTLDPV